MLEGAGITENLIARELCAAIWIFRRSAPPPPPARLGFAVLSPTFLVSDESLRESRPSKWMEAHPKEPVESAV